jgi:nitrogen regulatory protein P-II 1
MFLVVLVVDDPDNCDLLLESWEKAGIKGATIVESTGLGRVKKSWKRDDLPLMPSLRDIFQSDEVRHRTIFSVVESDAKVDAIVAATEKILGNLDNENNGFLFVVPVIRVHGLRLNQ